MNELKGPSAAHSDNLNPWDWKRERSPRTRNTAPAASSTQVTFDRLEALHNRYEGAPLVNAGEIPVDMEVPGIESASIPMSPALKEMVNTTKGEAAKENQAKDLGPAVLSRESIGVQVAPTLTNETTLAPTSSPELLKGYKERFFLKQDGYDDP